MSEYLPAYQGSVTKYVFVESTRFTAGDLALKALEVAEGVMIKETCFGFQVTGTKEEVDRVIEKVRAMDPNHIFVKDRGFPPGDPRRCRANLGGARPGFHGHEFELTLIRNISKGLERVEKAEEKGEKIVLPEKAEQKKLDARRLKQLADVEGP
ncbi:MAG: methanogenesis marker 6 protein [Methanomicrobiales archaeon]|nr:methanogenesis marker 6 protein [Methanomicrobiales archaeon]